MIQLGQEAMNTNILNITVVMSLDNLILLTMGNSCLEQFAKSSGFC